MELRQLRHFLALVEHGSYHRAAEHAAITPQALSASIAKLEQELGVRLFERGRVGLVPTAFAERLRPHATLACATAARARDELRELASAEGTRLVVGVGWFSSQVLAAAAVQELLATQARCDVTVVEGTSEELHLRLLRGELDVVLSTPSEEFVPSGELEIEVLWQSRDRAYARRGHPLAGRDRVPLAELVTFPWITSAGPESRTPRLFRVCDELSIPRPAQLLRTDSVHAIGRLVLATDAVMVGGALPPPFTLPFMDECVTFDVPELAATFRSLLAWRRHPAPGPAVARFVDAVHRLFARSSRPAA